MKNMKNFKKIFAILTAILLGIFLYSEALAAPGHPDPGSRVPPRTPTPPPPPKPVVKPKPKPAAKPAPAPVYVPTALDNGKALLEQGLFRAAKPHLLKAVKDQPNNAYSFYYLGQFYEKTGDFQNAQKNYTIAVQLDRQFPMLSRIVVYPDDPHGKNALWDPVRPRRIEKIDALGENGTAELPLGSRSNSAAPAQLPSAPEVPVYLPPEPETLIEETTEISPPVYAPPVYYEGVKK